MIYIGDIYQAKPGPKWLMLAFYNYILLYATAVT